MAVNGILASIEGQSHINLGQRWPGAYSTPVRMYVDSGPEAIVWRNPVGCATLCCFLARNVGLRLRVLIGESPEYDDYFSRSLASSYCNVGDNSAYDIPLADYLGDFTESLHHDPYEWPGESKPGEAPRLGPPAFLVCTETLDRIRLGIPYRAKGRIQHFYLENREKLSEDIPRMQAIFKFLAENTGKQLRVILEDELQELQTSGRVGREIGSARPGGIGFEEYLKGWPGLE